ncbi:MAG: Trm112 family protein, partial [Nocardioidaceae bacterium]
LDILVCPDCKGSLTVDHGHDELICNGCGLAYPVRDDIPVMLVDEARGPNPVEGGAEDQSTADSDPSS